MQPASTRRPAGRRRCRRPRQSGRELPRLGCATPAADQPGHRLAGRAHRRRDRALRGDGAEAWCGAGRAAARSLFLRLQARLDHARDARGASARRQGPPAARHHRRLLPRPPDRPLRDRRHHRLAHLADGPRHAAWDAELCALFGVPIEALPEIVPERRRFRHADRRRKPVPFTASLVDQQAALYGHGCRAPGDAKITFGTGAFALAVTGDGARRGGGLLPTVAWQRAAEAPVYALDGGVYSAAAAVNWARGLGLFEDFAEIDAFDAPPAIDRGLAFVPALCRARLPALGPRGARRLARPVARHRQGDMMQAVLEGVALRMAEVAARWRRRSARRPSPSTAAWRQTPISRSSSPMRWSAKSRLGAAGTHRARHGRPGRGGCRQALRLPAQGPQHSAAGRPEGRESRFSAAREAVQVFGANR